ncbi:MAG: aldo/keto reductase, partial [Pyrinomonadaceae bacterium]|nr:aldo/keto reductase [Pyrinomonadaceae bacterium]
MDRRDFLSKATAATALVAAQNIHMAHAATSSVDTRGLEPATQASGAQRATPVGGNMPYRTLGRTGEKVSAIGLGGHHIGQPKDPQQGIRIIRSAIDRGINFMDNCWDYHNGGSEIRMGKALRDSYRDKV